MKTGGQSRLLRPRGVLLCSALLAVGLLQTPRSAATARHAPRRAFGLTLLHRFPVGKASDDIAVILHSQVLVIAQEAGQRAVILDETTGRQRAIIHLFTGARHVAVDPVLHQIYLPDEYSGTLFVARYGQGWARLRTSIVRLNQVRPHAAAVNLRTHQVYVTNESSGTVSVIAGASLRVRATVAVGRGPGGIGVDQGTGHVDVVLVQENRVAILDGATDRVVHSIPVGRFPTHLAVDAATGRAFVVNTTAGTLSAVDDRRGTAAPPLAVGPKPYNVALDSARSLLVVASATAPELTLVDMRHRVVRATVGLDMVPGALAIDPQRQWIIVGGANRPQVEVFSYRDHAAH